MKVAVGAPGPVPSIASAVAAPRGARQVSIGQLNTFNLFDTRDDGMTADTVLTPEQYETRLTKVALAIRDSLKGADIVGLQEIEGDTVLRDLVARPEIAKYGYEWLVSPLNDPRGIRNGMLYRADRVELVPGEFTPGARAPNPVPRTPLPDKGNGHLNRALLYARPPLIADFRIRGAAQAAAGARELTVVVNHFKSRIGGKIYDPRRELQGAYLGGVVDGLRTRSPERPVVVMGDFNQDVGDDGFDRLVRGKDGKRRLVDTAERLPAGERYSYIYRGEKNLLDHILVSPDMVDAVKTFRIERIGTTTTKTGKDKVDDPTTKLGASDHDALYAVIDLAKQTPSAA